MSCPLCRTWAAPVKSPYTVMGSRITVASQGLDTECHPSEHSDDSQGLNRHGSRPEIGFSDAESLRWKFKLDRRLSLRGAACWNLRTGTFFFFFFPAAEDSIHTFFLADLRGMQKQRVGSVTVGSAQKYLWMRRTDSHYYIQRFRGQRLKNRCESLQESQKSFYFRPCLQFYLFIFLWNLHGHFIFSYTFKPTLLVLLSLLFYYRVVSEKQTEAGLNGEPLCRGC